MGELYQTWAQNMILTRFYGLRHTWSAEGGSSVDLVDVPGSERVRGTLVEKYGPGSRGILFVVDSATITKQIRDVAEFLHSILSLPAVASNSPPLMVLCNKQDVGVAKGESVIKSLLEKEVDKVRVSRGNQLAGLEGANNDSVFIGKVESLFPHSTLCRILANFSCFPFYSTQSKQGMLYYSGGAAL